MKCVCVPLHASVNTYIPCRMKAWNDNTALTLHTVACVIIGCNGRESPLTGASSVSFFWGVLLLGLSHAQMWDMSSALSSRMNVLKLWLWSSRDESGSFLGPICCTSPCSFPGMDFWPGAWGNQSVSTMYVGTSSRAKHDCWQMWLMTIWSLTKWWLTVKDKRMGLISSWPYLPFVLFYLLNHLLINETGLCYVCQADLDFTLASNSPSSCLLTTEVTDVCNHAQLSFYIVQERCISNSCYYYDKIPDRRQLMGQKESMLAHSLWGVVSHGGEGIAIGESVVLTSERDSLLIRSHILKVPWSLQVAPASGDQVFRHVYRWGHFPFKA